MSACLFCRIVSGEIPAKIAHQDDDVVAFHDIAPQAPVHVLVVPRQHVATLDEMAAEGDGATAARLFAGVQRTAAALGLTAGAGYRQVVNCGDTAGQSVFHVHVHLLAGRAFGWPPG